MARETIEGPARPIRVVVCEGRTVQLESDTIPIGEPDTNGVQHRIPNPRKFSFGPGEEIDVSPEEFAYMHPAGFVRRLDEDPAVMVRGNLSFPAGGAAPIGNVKNSAGLN